MKAILVIDMPPTCCECPCEYDYLRCKAKPNIMPNYCERPKCCPLKPMPERKGKYGELNRYDTDNHYEKGWNACLDEILGGKDD